MFSAGLLIALAGTCACQQQPAAGAVSQASFQTGTAAVVQQPQTKLDDIERDSLAAAFGQKTQQQQPAKPSAVAAPAVPQQQQQQQQQQQAYQAVLPQQQYFMQPYQAQQQFYVQPYQAQQQQYLAPYQMAFDYSGVQYMFINPNAYNAGNQVYQQYYVPAPQPSAVPQYVTKQSSPAVAAAPVATQARQEYKQQKSVAPGQAPQEYQQQPYVQVPTVGFQQYVQQPAAVASPVDFSYVTRHPAQFKAPAPAVQPQFQFAAVPQQYVQQPQPQQQPQQQQPQQQQPQQQQPQQQQYYYNYLAAVGQAAAEQPRVQQSAKSQFSSGVKSTTPAPFKESFAYKFESSPSQQQQSGAAYSTLRYSV